MAPIQQRNSDNFFIKLREAVACSAPSPIKMFFLLSLFIFLIGTGTQPSAAETNPTSLNFNLFYQITDTAGGGFGSSVSGAGDIDGDGVPDFIIGAPNANPNGIIDAGSVFIYSGVHGKLIRRIDYSSPNSNFGYSVSGGKDANDDGIPDIIVGAPKSDMGGLLDAGSISVYSGANYTLLYEIHGTSVGDQLGNSVVWLEDIDSDRKADFVAGAYLADPANLVDAGSAFVYSGKDGSLLYRKDGSAVGQKFGWSVNGGKDIDGDIKSEFIIGGGYFKTCVYSGATGALLHQENVTGIAVALLGDINKDSVGDFVAGNSNYWCCGPNVDCNYGEIYAFSGANGGSLFHSLGGCGMGLGSWAANTGDLDGDGLEDYLLGSRGIWNSNGTISVFSGATSALFFERSGRVGAGIGDLNADGRNDLIIGDPYGSTNPKTVYVYGLSCPALKGDLNSDSSRTLVDVMLLLNAVFLGEQISVPRCSADLNCDFLLSPADVVVLLLVYFANIPITCTL